MYQVVGKILDSNKIVGLEVFDYSNKLIIAATIKDCINEINSGTMLNLVVNDKGAISVTDGNIKDLPSYDVNGNPSSNNIPVILERVTSNGNTVGYTLITKEGYKKYKTSDLLKKYREFYNAKIVTKDGSIFLSAKRGTFKELKLDELKEKSITSVPDEYSHIPDFNSFVCNPTDFITRDTEYGKVLIEYIGNDRKIRVPDDIVDIEGFFSSSKLNAIFKNNALNKDNCTTFEIILPASLGFGIPNNYDENIYQFVYRIGLTLKNSFKNIYVSSNNKYLVSNDGVVFSKDMKFLATITAPYLPYPKKMESYTVPEGVKVIATSAFNGVQIRDLTIPSSVINIQPLADIFITDTLTISDNWFSDYVSIDDCIKNRYSGERSEEIIDAFFAEDYNIGRIFTIKNFNVIKSGRKPLCKSVDGFLTSVDGTELLISPLGRVREGLELRIPDCVKTIGSEALTVTEQDILKCREKDLRLVLSDNISDIQYGSELNDLYSSVTVIANRGTYAEQWAKENGCNFIAKSDCK